MTKDVVQSQDKYVLRLPDGMRDRLKTAAEKNTRSMNAEIVDRLERSLVGVDATEPSDLNMFERIELARHRLRQAMAALDELEIAEMLG